MINAINTALSGLNAASKKIEASASNIANLTTSGSLKDPNNAPYSAVTTVQDTITDSNGKARGVRANIIPKDTPFVPAFSPDSPFADDNGMIGVPNINLAEEGMNIIAAKIAFKANLKIIEANSEMFKDLFRIFDSKI